MIVPTIDILVAEQLKFAERVNSECQSKGEAEKVEVMIVEGAFHGWLECESVLFEFCGGNMLWEANSDA